MINMNSIAVITSIYGDHDSLKEQPEQSVDVEWICVTDRNVNSNTWSVIVEPRPAVSDRLASKFAKCLPHLYTTANIVIWIDGAYQFFDSGGVERLVEWADGSPIAQFRHYSRNCVYDEAEVSKNLPKYSFQPIDTQMSFYRKNWEFPEDMGLFAGGVIVRNYRYNIFLRNFGIEWLAHQIRWTDQDQLSEMPILFKQKLKMTELPGNLLDNEAIRWVGHLKGEHR
jgi:hypothetical protein